MRKLLLLSALLWAGSAHAAIQYAGGTNVNAQCTATAGTIQELSDCVQDNLVVAGWTVVSGSHTTSVLLQSLATPTAGLQMRLALTQGANCLILKGRNVGNTKSNATGQFLLPASAKVYRVVANKYQYFISPDGSPLARSWAAGGVPYVPSFAGITECIWTAGNSLSDTDTAKGPSFKDVLDMNVTLGTGGFSNQANYWVVTNGSQLEYTSTTSTATTGVIQFLLPQTANATQALQATRWFDNSSFISEALIAFALTLPASAEPKVMGLIWDAAIITAAIASETTLTFDSHNWIVHTNNNTGAGTLVLVVP